MLVLVGASMMSVFAMVTSLVQLITTNEMRGRVMSVYNCAFRGGMPMGNLLSGWLVPDIHCPADTEHQRIPADRNGTVLPADSETRRHTVSDAPGLRPQDLCPAPDTNVS